MSLKCLTSACLASFANKFTSFLTLFVDRLSPNLPFGKIENDTELIISPFYGGVVYREKSQSITNGNDSNNYRLQHCQSAIIPRDQFLYQNGDSTSRKPSAVVVNPWNEKLTKRLKHLEDIKARLVKETPQSYQLRVISGKWDTDKGQMSDVYISGTDVLPSSVDLNQIFVLITKFDREYCVNVKVRTPSTDDQQQQSIYPTIEINDVLMAQLNIENYEKIILKPKNFVMNFVDTIELQPSNKNVHKRDVEHLFKQFIMTNAKSSPILINRNQIFKLRDDLYVTIRLLPDTFKFCAIDSAILRECRINVVETVKEVDSVLNIVKNVDAPIFDRKSFVEIEKFDDIVDDCIDRLTVNLCLDERNRFRKTENIILVGKLG